MAEKGFTVDLNKPLVFQVGHLGETYQEWVHTPILTQESPRFFESDLMELLSRTMWWVVPVVWLPVAFYFFVMSYTMGLTLPEVAMLSVSGSFVWTFLEYCIHRSFSTLTQDLLGKHLSLSHPWFPPQTPYGWPTPCDSTFRSCNSSGYEISHEPSLQDSKQGLWCNDDVMGQSF
ncbi:Fatty acid 2-hydroxylase 1 [Hibiscus syriacus]|uniref:Fatty acid 2-hydroxylase 1 n=1 Tax=Hibiscus syriacus TaxID=106335 RepID=A0A6A2ZDE4_HIBSY|nr:Fatty acid 2-hydroxylase 1 [Hibiscus syriacus]